MKTQNRVPAEATPKNSAYKIKPIPTYYSGVKFRSHLEASYAFFFDEYEIKWQYEVEGYDLDGLWYLPDFWLPEIKTFFEVKGVLENIEKPRKLAEALEGDYWGFPEILVVVGDSYGKVFSPIHRRDNAFSMAKCAKCGKYWFYLDEGFWQCRACGEYEGDHHLRDQYSDNDVRSLTSLIGLFVEPKRRVVI